MPKKRRKDKSHTIYFIVGIVVICASIIFGLYTQGNQSYSLSGAVVVQNGQLNQIDAQQKGNPNYGALSGTLTFIINGTNGNIISTDPGAGFILYFSQHNIENWNLVKNNTDNYPGELTDVDADGSSSTCSSNDYETIAKYYDTDNDNTKDPNEKDIYAIITDSNGCFAVKMPPGSYDIYG